MTCIASYRDSFGNIFMGGDSIAFNEYTYITLNVPKVFIKSNMIFGFAGWLRMGQILQYDFDIPVHPKGMDDYTYLISIFMDKLMTRYEDKKYAHVLDNAITVPGTFLVGYNQKIYKIEDNFQILETNRNYEAAGCGEDFALGAFWSMEKKNMNPIKLVEKVLQCASEFSLVKKPFVILKLNYESGLNE